MMVRSSDPLEFEHLSDICRMQRPKQPLISSHRVVFHSLHFHIPVQLRSTNAIRSDFQQVHGLGRQMDLVALRLEEKVREASAAFHSPMKESSTRAALTNQGSSSLNDSSRGKKSSQLTNNDSTMIQGFKRTSASWQLRLVLHEKRHQRHSRQRTFRKPMGDPQHFIMKPMGDPLFFFSSVMCDPLGIS